MERYDQLYSLYDEFDTDSLQAYADFVDLFPPVDSRVALEYWQSANEELTEGKDEIREAFPASGETFADIAAMATRDQAFTALDLYSKYGRAVNVLVLDVDETLRSAGRTDNEIPRETLYLLREIHDESVPIVVCTGQTLENVKGFMIQGLGNEMVHSGEMSIVYEAGTGVFTPGHGGQTKQLLYENLDETIRAIFGRVRSRVLPDAPEDLRRGCHLQGNEFNVTLKPNFETGSSEAEEIIDEALVYMLDLLGESVAAELDADLDPAQVRPWTRAYYAGQDPEIRGVLEETGELPDEDGKLADADGEEGLTVTVEDVLERIDVAYYEADAAEIGSLELNKVVGVQSAIDVLGVDDPFCLVMGDSKSDLRVMRWVEEEGCGLAAAPAHSSRDVLDHAIRTDELVFEPGQAADVLTTIATLNRLARLYD